MLTSILAINKFQFGLSIDFKVVEDKKKEDDKKEDKKDDAKESDAVAPAEKSQATSFLQAVCEGRKPMVEMFLKNEKVTEAFVNNRVQGMHGTKK
jgi:hypothetical protein